MPAVNEKIQTRTMGSPEMPAPRKKPMMAVQAEKKLNRSARRMEKPELMRIIISPARETTVQTCASRTVVNRTDFTGKLLATDGNGLRDAEEDALGERRTNGQPVGDVVNTVTDDDHPTDSCSRRCGRSERQQTVSYPSCWALQAESHSEER